MMASSKICDNEKTNYSIDPTETIKNEEYTDGTDNCTNLENSIQLNLSKNKTATKKRGRPMKRKNKTKKLKLGTKAPSLKVFKCPTCEHKFKTWNALKIHCNDYHDSPPLITCICGKPLFTRTSVVEHRAMHLGRNRYDCDKCEKTYYRKSMLELHAASHLPKDQQPFVCCKCARRFSSDVLLKNHERVHLSKEEKLIYPCHLCRKMFSSNSAVSSHLRAVHLGERPFVCDQCGQTFAAKGNLQEHQTVHSDDTPWHCSVCNKRFKTKYRLKIHMDTHRSSLYQCPKCPLQLSTKRTLRMHLFVHSEGKAYQCSVCGKAFKRSKDLKNHNNLHTGQRPYSCPFCLRTFANGSNCRAHKRRMHPEELQLYEESLQESLESEREIRSKENKTEGSESFHSQLFEAVSSSILTECRPPTVPAFPGNPCVYTMPD